MGASASTYRDRLATKADLYTVAPAIVAVNADATFGLLELLLP